MDKDNKSPLSKTATDRQIEDEGICSTCRGHGSFGTSKEDEDGTVTIDYKHCEDCGGTGFDQSNGDFD